MVRKGRAANPTDDPLMILAGLGGRELAAIVGAVCSARLKRIPVILDGYVCTAAAAVLHAVRKDALDHCLVGHVSAEPGHRLLLEKLEKRPLLDLDMRLGEGSGAAVALPVKFLAGPMRGSFNPHDGHLYVAGSTGWQTSAAVVPAQ